MNRKVLILGIVGVLVLMLLVASVLLHKKAPIKQYAQDGSLIPTIAVQRPNPTLAQFPELLQFSFTYDPNTGKLGISKMMLTRGNADATTSDFYPYTLTEVDQDNNTLFVTKFAVTQMYYIENPYERSGEQQPRKPTSTIVVVPFNENAAKVIITKNQEKVLEFVPIK